MPGTTIGQIRSPSTTVPIRFFPKMKTDVLLMFDSANVFFGSTPGEAQQWNGGASPGTLPANTTIRWAAGNEFWLITNNSGALVTVGYILTELPEDA